MLQLSFAKDIDCYHQLDKEEVLSIVLAITEEALSIRGIKEYLESKGR